MESKVIIVGAGLAGLSCANYLHRRGIATLILEAGDRVGGRVQTDIVEGFRLDRGFQVFLDSYPEPRQLIHLDTLQLRPFEAGAMVRFNGKFYSLTDPWRNPLKSLAGIFSPIGGLQDKLRVAQFRSRVVKTKLDQLLREEETTTQTRLQSFGFSDKMIDRFFRPFLGGIFLDHELQTSSRMLDFVFRMFSTGMACLPEKGMASIPETLAANLTGDSIRFHSRVVKVDDAGVELESGEKVCGPSVVIATDGPSADRLVNANISTFGRDVWCLYFVANTPPIATKSLVLNGDGQGPINNLCVPTNVAASYGNGKEHLLSVTSLSSYESPEHLFNAVRDQLVEWYGDPAQSWRLLRTYRIPYALPNQAPPHLTHWERDVRLRPGLYLCGDHRDDASINGAIKSGRRAAEAIVNGFAR